MSNKNLGRVKQIRQRTSSNTYAMGIPIGTDGLLVDMISSLDLEEELRLGGNHYATINQTDIAVQIKEWYFSQARGTKTLEQMSEYVTYSVFVSIINAIQNNIVENNEGIDNPLVTENGEGIVERIASTAGKDKIYIALYEGDMNDNENSKLLHEKVIYIEDTDDGQIIVDEQIEGGNG